MARFDPDVVHKCALECLGKPKPEMFEAFAKALAAHYPNVLDFSQPWIYSLAGGAMKSSITGDFWQSYRAL